MTQPRVAHYLAEVTTTEEQLRDALLLVAGRHERNYEVSRGATLLAAWSSDKVARLLGLRRRYGHAATESAASLRSALFAEPEPGVVGELRDLRDLASLTTGAELTWTILVQGARELHDAELLHVATAAREQTRRQIAWFRTQVEHEAPDAIAVVPG
jgi:hypothetical protein